MADRNAWLATTRLEALIDGIFAFAMTLLVLSISMPQDADDLGYIPNAELRDLIMHEWRRFLNYAIAFLLLASFWMSHSKEFHMIKATEHRHTWINILFLMFVALVPFTTDLIGDYGQDKISWTIFGANMFILGSFLYMNWWYASKNNQLLREGVGREHVKAGKMRGMVVPFVAALSILVAQFDTNIAGYMYLLIPLILMLPIFHASYYRKRMLTQKKK